MKNILAILIWMVCFQGCYQVATALRCLKCFSYTSMADCMSKASAIKCNDEYDRCSNTTVQIYVDMMKETLVGYELGCAKEAECQQQLCARHFGIAIGVVRYKNCHITCCPRDLCPLQPNATLHPPKDNADKGARGGVGIVAIDINLFIWISLVGVIFILF